MKRKAHDKKERPEPAKKPVLWKRLLAAVLGPLSFLILVELVLSLAGYGLPKAFFIPWKVAGQTLYLANEHYCEHFVPKSLSRTPEPCVLGPKGESTIRIFVLGSSAAYGDPEPAYGFCRQLELLLNEHASGKSFEVVNAAVTAMNSHVAKRIAGDCVAQKPDLFILFMGNNEVVGPYGPPTLPASLYSSRRFINACITAKKETRIGQFLKNLSLATNGKGQADAKWQGMESFLTSRIARDDPKLRDCYRHFRSNLDDIIRIARGCGARVLLCTVPVNIRSCAPFGSQHKAGLPAEALAQWDRAFQEGRALERAGDFAGALAAYEKARRIDDSHADLAFCMGRCLAALGRTDEARRVLVEARDLDVLRFRADSSILRVIRETAQAWSAKDVRLLDLDANAADLFVDHVHLDFRGNFLAALAALRQIREMMPQAALVEPKGSEDELLDLCRRRLLYDEHEQYRLAMVMYRRKTIPPFSEQIDHDAELAGLRAELLRLRQVEKGVKEPESVYLEAVRRRPLDTYLILRHGQFLMATGRPREAMEMYRKALDTRPFDMRIRVALSQVFILGNMRDEAVDVLTSRQTPDRYTRKDALLSLGAFCAQTGNIAQATAIYEELSRMDSRNLDILVNQAAAASQRDDLPAMKRYLDKALELAPNSVLAATNMGNYCAKRSQPAEAQKWFVKATQLDPRDPFAHIGAGIQSVRLKQMDKATEHLTRAVALKPDFVEAYLLLAAIHDQAGRKEEAKKYLDLASLFRPGPQP
ncbi:MAG: tetratricopeptide repeat protein [Phycisphaerales bacterium]